MRTVTMLALVCIAVCAQDAPLAEKGPEGADAIRTESSVMAEKIFGVTSAPLTAITSSPMVIGGIEQGGWSSPTDGPRDTEPAIIPTVAVCDSATIVQATSAALREELGILRAEVQARNKAMDDKQAEIDGLKRKSGKEYEELVQQLADIKAANNIWAAQNSKAFTAKLRTVSREAIAKVAKDKNIYLVLAKGNVLYADDSMDITETVVSEIAKKKE